MTVILIMLVGVLMGAFNFGFLCLGYYLGAKKQNDEALSVTKENEEWVKQMAEWKAYMGGK